MPYGKIMISLLNLSFEHAYGMCVYIHLICLCLGIFASNICDVDFSFLFLLGKLHNKL